MRTKRIFLFHHIFSNQQALVKQVFLFSAGSFSLLTKKIPNLAPVPSKPTIDDFARPITQITNEKNNTTVITPKKPLPKIKERNLSQQLQSIFPDVNKTIKEESETFQKIEDLDEIINKVSNIDNDQQEQKIFKVEFFTGGTNQNFDSFVQKFGLLSENLEFLDFLQWDYCIEILESNDLKVHIETGNIYYKNNNNNKSIFEFVENQQDSSKGKMIFNLMYDGNYNDYFQWILSGFHAYEKTKLDLLTFKNTKYLLYRFNDLLESTGQPITLIKHSKVTDDYISAEEIQNQTWQYFIE